jgi:uncharacterized protein (DUF2249 family)
MTFTIETEVPIPTRRGGRPAGTKYPLEQMDVGHSFLVTSDVKPATVRSAIGNFCKDKPEYKFTMRAVDGGVRVWRVAPDPAS